jgi:exodeoxyribonuclease VIII
VVVQVGAAVHDTAGRVVGHCQVNVDINSCLELGARFDHDTLAWWTEQPGLKAVIGHPSRFPIRHALEVLSRLHRLHRPRRVWSHGASFDLPILGWYLDRLGMEAPWDYRDIRDTRTLFETAAFFGWERPQRETAHTALADASAQAQDVAAALTHLEVARAQARLSAQSNTDLRGRITAMEGQQAELLELGGDTLRAAWEALSAEDED